MTSFKRATTVALLSGAFALALASTALAGTYTLSLSGPSTGTVGQTLAITATGYDPPQTGYFGTYIEIDAIPTSLTSTCPALKDNGMQLAASTPSGAFIAFDQPENYDSSGNFSGLYGWTPYYTGQYVICGYTDDGLYTLATASMLIDVAAAPIAPTPPPPTSTPPPSSTPTAVPAPTASKPLNTVKPQVTRSGNTLRCSTGSWSNAPQHYSYRWLVGHKVKHGARGRTLGSAHRLRGLAVQCSVTASNSAGSTTAISAAVKVH